MDESLVHQQFDEINLMEFTTPRMNNVCVV